MVGGGLTHLRVTLQEQEVRGINNGNMRSGWSPRPRGSQRHSPEDRGGCLSICPSTSPSEPWAAPPQEGTESPRQVDVARWPLLRRARGESEDSKGQ